MSISTIHEYTILYSDRLTQKDKKWVDGVLKYYEFNNKIEIFNEDGLLVRSDFRKVKFAVGEQYTISKLLVEITGYSGMNQRDILQLFTKEEKPEAPKLVRKPIPNIPLKSLSLMPRIKNRTMGAKPPSVGLLRPRSFNKPGSISKALKFKIQPPIIKRVPPQSSNIYRFQ